MHRLLKVAQVASSSAFCLFYAFQNLVNLGPAYGFVQYVTGMVGHEAYPGHFGPAVFIWFGVFSAVGGACFQMWQTEAGASALQGAFQYAMLNGLVWLMVSRDDD